MVTRTITLLVLVWVYQGWDPNHFQKPNSGLYQTKTLPNHYTLSLHSLSPLLSPHGYTDSGQPPTPSPIPSPPSSLSHHVTITWYDYGDANPRTACGDRLNPNSFTAAIPISWPQTCYDTIILCTHAACVRTIVNDHIPSSSSSRYQDLIVDVTPAVMTALGIPFGRTAAGIPYGRATVDLR